MMATKYAPKPTVKSDIVSGSIKQESRNRYRSVASQMMLTEISRVVPEVAASHAGLSSSDVQRSLLKTLARYTGSQIGSLALASDRATIISALKQLRGKHTTNVTYIGPTLTVSNESESDSVKVIDSLADCKRQEIEQAIPDSTGLLYLASPNLLNGEIYSASQIRRILESVGSALVIVDEALFEYCQATCVTLLDEFDNLVILRTLREAFGLERTPLIYAIGAGEVIESVKRSIPTDGLSFTTQVTAIAALRRPDVMCQAVNVVCENRVYLTALLRHLGAEVMPTASNFVLVRVMEPELALSALSLYGVTLCEFERYGTLKQYLRIPIGDDSYCRSIVAAFTRCPRERYKPMLRQSAPISHSSAFANNMRREHTNIYNNTKEA